MLRQIRLLIFDLDFLVFDCGVLKERALRQSLVSFADCIPQSLRLPDTVDIEEAFRKDGSRWIRSLEIGLDENQLVELEETYRVQETCCVDSGIGQIFPGMRDLLVSCRQEGASLALGAESSRDYLMSVCDRHDCDQLFEIALCSEEYGMGSTDEMLTEIMSRAEVNASETLILGTTPFYFEAGHNNDIRSISCGWGIHEQGAVAIADFQSPSIAHLYPIIQQADALASGFST